MADRAKSFEEAQAIFEAAVTAPPVQMEAPIVEIPEDAQVELDESVYTWSDGDEPIYIQGPDGRYIQILTAKIVDAPVEQTPTELPEEPIVEEAEVTEEVPIEEMV